MKYSKLFIRTLKESPSDAKGESFKLLLKGGFIRRLTNGFYTYLPLGCLLLRKIKNIIIEELEKKDFQEILFPLLTPFMDIAEAFHLKDRTGRSFSLGLSDDSIIKELIKNEVRSYKELPLYFYHINTDFRDDLKSRFGLIRPKEFLKLTSYCFCNSEEEGNIIDLYYAIFRSLFITVKVFNIDNKWKFIFINAPGEEDILICSDCNYEILSELAGLPDIPVNSEECPPMEKVHTPGSATIEEVTAFLREKSESFVKTLIYKADDKAVAALIRGDRELNHRKLKNFLRVHNLEMADEEIVKKVTGAPVGFAGPVGLKIKVIADSEIKNMPSSIVGANEGDFHYKNVKPGRDFTVDDYTDLRLASEGDRCTKCGKPFKITKGLLLGEAEKAGKIDQNVYMVRSSLFISQALASIVEEHHDGKGIVWPLEVSPFKVLILLLNVKDKELVKMALKIYEELKNKGIETLLDDRDINVGTKFKDGDLMGIPIQMAIGNRSLKENSIEIIIRKTGEKIKISPDRIGEIEKLIF